MSTQTISSGQTVSGSIVSSGNTEIVLLGGSAVDTTVLSGGAFVFAGGFVSGLTVSSGGREEVTSSARVHGLVVGIGVTADIHSGGAVVGGSILSGGVVSVFSSSVTGTDVGGSVSGLVVRSGGVLDDSGRANNTRVLNGGALRDDGEVDGAVISSGGTLDVLKAGYAGGIFVLSGGHATVAGQLVETVVSHGGMLRALAGNLSSATIDGTLLAVSVTSLTVGSGGVAHLLAPSNSTSRGNLTSATVERGGKLIMSRTSASRLLVDGGVATLLSGALALSPIVRSGGALIVQSGATTSNIALQNGKELVASGGVVAGRTAFGKNATLALINTAPDLSASGFKATDEIDLKSFKFSSLEKFSFVENTAKTQGTLTVIDGTLTAKITLFGNYTAAGFALSSDATGGTAVTTSYSPPSSSHPDLAPNHH